MNKPNHNELLTDLQAEVPSSDDLGADLLNAETCETLDDFIANMREAAQSARALAKVCDELANQATAAR